MDEHDLHRLTRPLVADPVIEPAPVAELERRVARRARRRGTALAVAVVVVLLAGGTALARAGRQSSSERVGTTTPTTIEVRLPLTVWLYPTATPAEVAAVQAALVADPGATRVVYQDQADAYGQFRCLFATHPDLIASVTPAQLPTSFGVEADGGQSALDEVARRVAPLEGIKEVAARRPYTVPDDLPTTTSFGQQAPTASVIAQAEQAQAQALAQGASPLPNPPCPFLGTTLKS